MNNFSPSTDTSVGTKRFTAQEVQLAYTLMAVDPIVYQPCAYGILIHSMWGEESEDKVFEEYKRINNLML